MAENRRRALAAAGGGAASLCLARQVHGTHALVVESAWPEREAPRADAHVTALPGLALGVTSADCAPVLVADPEAGIVAAAHAGWRGALGGIVEATVAAMTGIGAAPTRMIAAIGPCIAKDSYEVGAAFAASFMAQDPGNRRFFAAAGDGDDARLRFDLPAYVRSRALAGGRRDRRRAGGSTPAPTSAASSATVAPTCAASLAMGSASRSSPCAASAMPYAALFCLFVLLALLAVCAF